MRFSFPGAAAAAAAILMLAAPNTADAFTRGDDPSRPVIDGLQAEPAGTTAAPAASTGSEATQSATVTHAMTDDPANPVIDHGESGADERTAGTGSAQTAAAPAERTAAPTSGSSRPHGDLIARHAEAAGVPVQLAKAVVRIESNFNARARGRAGEVGLMQIKPQTARGIGYTGSIEALYDPDTNLRWGMKYLAGAYKLAGGDICGTVMRYQGGHYARRMTGANRTYCSRVQNFMANGTIRSASL